jgi:hypothetical protein
LPSAGPLPELALFYTTPHGGAMPTARRADELALFCAVAHVCHPRHPSFNPQSRHCERSAATSIRTPGNV